MNIVVWCYRQWEHVKNCCGQCCRSVKGLFLVQVSVILNLIPCYQQNKEPIGGSPPFFQRADRYDAIVVWLRRTIVISPHSGWRWKTTTFPGSSLYFLEERIEDPVNEVAFSIDTRENGKAAFSNSSGLKSVYENLRFLDLGIPPG